MNKKLFSITLAFFLAVSNTFSLEVPRLERRVMDIANLMNKNDRENTENYLAALENTSGIQIAVLTIPSLEGENLEDYSMKVCEKWKLGQSSKDNGALLLIAFKEKKIRIETGYSLEEKLTATKCGLIIRNIIKPAFTTGRYSDGIVEAIKTMGGIASDNAELISPKLNKNKDSGFSNILKGILIMFVWFIFCSCLASGKKNHFLPWIIFSSAFRSSHRGSSYYRKNDHFDNFGGFGGGSNGGFGGFSGGGGGFGGGGASGGW